MRHVKFLIILFTFSCVNVDKLEVYDSNLNTDLNEPLKPEPQPEPEPGQTIMATSVSIRGITWTFQNETPIGRFVTGDYYVVGETTIVSITPPPANGRNGSVLNLPPKQDRSGFDSRVSSGRYDESLRISLPATLKPGDSLASSISVAEGAVGSTYRWLREGNDRTVSPVKSVEILTCLSQAVTEDAFRPSYSDKGNKIYYARNLRRSLLPRLNSVSGTPAIQTYINHFSRPWIDNVFFGFDMPIDYMPDYGREIARAVGMASLLLMLDYSQEQKEPLLIGLVQYGIDLWGLIREGHLGWQAHGGHGSGRKWPIIFAGIMLGDSEMESPNTHYPNVLFGEDMQTIYGAGWTGATALYGGHVGKNGDSVKAGWGAYEHLEPSQWTKNESDGFVGEGYRRCCTSVSWVGEALAARLLKATSVWNHNAFFDYVDRWMQEDDTEHVNIILSTTGVNYSASWSRQRQAWDSFVENMWRDYR